MFPIYIEPVRIGYSLSCKDKQTLTHRINLQSTLRVPIGVVNLELQSEKGSMMNRSSRTLKKIEIYLEIYLLKKNIEVEH